MKRNMKRRFYVATGKLFQSGVWFRCADRNVKYNFEWMQKRADAAWLCAALNEKHERDTRTKARKA